MDNKLLVKMQQERYTQRLAARKIGMPIGVFNSRIHKKTEWKMSEMVEICKLLNITAEQFIELCR